MGGAVGGSAVALTLQLYLPQCVKTAWTTRPLSPIANRSTLHVAKFHSYVLESQSCDNDANYTYSPETSAYSPWNLPLHYFVDGFQTIPELTRRRASFENREEAIFPRRETLSNSQWLHPLLQSCSRLLERSSA